jgi:hypothetical protein
LCIACTSAAASWTVKVSKTSGPMLEWLRSYALQVCHGIPGAEPRAYDHGARVIDAPCRIHRPWGQGNRSHGR